MRNTTDVTDLALSELVRDAAAELGIAGAQVSLLYRGTLTTGVAGVANITSGVPVTPDTLFQTGSTAKILTAALAMGLVDEGVISLDIPVVDQLPDFVLSDSHATRTITPRHLMSMSSGMDNGPYTDHGRGDDALARYVAALSDLPQVFRAGNAFGYSNASTTVTGRLVEHVTGQTWENALRTRILEPVRMLNTVAFPEDIIHRSFAIGHLTDEGGVLIPLQTWSHLSARARCPSGSTLWSTTNDLVRFAELFLKRRSESPLSPRVVQAMQSREVLVPPTLVADWWGLGALCNVWDGVEVWGHFGTQHNASSLLRWVPERDIALATMVNVPTLGFPFAARIVSELFPGLAGIAVPARPNPPEDVEVNVERLIGTYVMTGTTLTVSRGTDNGISITAASTTPNMRNRSEPSRLVPLSPTTFLPTDRAIDGGRGWALAFVGPDDEPTAYLLNGVFPLRRVA